MSLGTYGTIRPADVLPQDMEIFYHYSKNRGVTTDLQLKTDLNPEDVIQQTINPNGSGTEIFGGLYNLTLPADKFTTPGIYTIVIKPKEIRATILDCGVLTVSSDVKGLTFAQNDIGNFGDGELVGYRIEYLDDDGNKIPNKFTIITSNNKCEVVNQNISDNNQKAIRFRLNRNASTIFCTVSPSSASSIKPNAEPFIGSNNQSVILTNTNFNPIMLEVEIVEHDIETLAYGIFGNQSKSVEDGIYTVYNFQDDIYKQWDLYEIKDQFNGTPLYEIRQERTNIDETKDFDDITNVE